MHNELVARYVPELLYTPWPAETDRPVILHRQLMLFLAKEAAVHCSTEGKSPWNKSSSDLATLILMGNDRIGQREGTKLCENNLDFLAGVVSSGEGSRFPSWRSKLVRPSLVLDLLEADPDLSKQFDVPSLFAQATGVPLRTYLCMVFAVASKKLNEEVAPGTFPDPYSIEEKWFSSTIVPHEQIEAFLRDISGTPDELSASIRSDRHRPTNDFARLADKPLIKIGERFYPLDFDLVAGKSESGIFWRSAQHLAGRRSDFFSFWGEVFERYICWLLSAYLKHPTSDFFPHPRWDDRPSKQVSDGIVVTGGTACFLECKGNVFNAEAKYGGVSSRLKEEIDQKLIGDSSSKKGLLQLSEAVANVSAPTHRAIRGVDLSHVTRIFPVLVVRDDIALSMCFNEYLNFRFKRLVQRKKNSRIITPVFCLAADDLERLSTYLERFPLHEILEARWRQDKQLKLPFFAVANPKMLNPEGQAPKVLRDGMELLAEHTARLLFGTSRTGEPI